MNGYDWTTKIVNIRESQGVNEQNAIEPRITVQFNVGPHGPFTIDFPKQGFNPALAKTTMDQFAAQLKQLAS